MTTAIFSPPLPVYILHSSTGVEHGGDEFFSFLSRGNYIIGGILIDQHLVGTEMNRPPAHNSSLSLSLSPNGGTRYSFVFFRWKLYNRPNLNYSNEQLVGIGIGI
jgi:hypothetical protein